MVLSVGSMKLVDEIIAGEVLSDDVRGASSSMASARFRSKSSSRILSTTPFSYLISNISVKHYMYADDTQLSLRLISPH